MSEQDIAHHPSFNELPAEFAESLRTLPYTGEGREDEDFSHYHEVTFHLQDCSCTCVVLYCKWAALPLADIAQITAIAFVLDKEGKKMH